MEIPQDYKELLALLSKHKVEFIVVGGYALAFHGAPRYTGDIDLWVKPDSVNASRVVRVLEAFGFDSIGLTDADFTKQKNIVQLGVPPLRVDIVTSISGVSWEDASAGSVSGILGETPVRFLGRTQFIENKRAVGRKKDLADLEALGEE